MLLKKLIFNSYCLPIFLDSQKAHHAFSPNRNEISFSLHKPRKKVKNWQELTAGWAYGYFCCLNKVLKHTNHSFNIHVEIESSKTFLWPISNSRRPHGCVR